MVNSEAKAHTFLTLFPSWRASVLSCIVQKPECYSLKANPVFRKSKTELTAQHIGITQDVILSCNGEMSVQSVSVFAACVLKKQLTYTPALYVLRNWDRFICLEKFSIWQADGRSAQQFLEALKDVRTYMPVLMGSCFLRLHSPSQEYFETKFSELLSITDFNQVCCTTYLATVLVSWKQYSSFPP